MTASRRTEDADAWRRRTLWFPPMHPVGPRLVAAAIASNGVETRVLPPEDDEAYAIGRRLMRGNECLPAPLTLGGFLKQMERERREGRDPGREAALFMPTACGPCRFGQYRTLQRQALDRAGLSSVPIVSPGSEDTYFAMKPVSLGWDAVLASDILFKMRCKVRPYERSAGDAEQVLERWVSRLERLVSSGRVAWADELGAAMAEFLRLPVRPVRKPLVGIVGEIYVRSDPYANGRVVEAVEALGGEAWLAPLAEWIEYTAWIEHFLARRRGDGLLSSVAALFKRRWVTGRARRMYRPVARMLHDREEPEIERVIETGRRLLPVEFEGESVLTVGRAALFQEDGCRLVVNCAPFGCMHGNITSAIFEQRRAALRIPVVNAFYDGAGDNAELATFLQQAVRGCEAGQSA